MPGLCIIPARALEDEECKGPRLRALCAIGTFTSRDGGGVWAANDTLAEKAKIDEREFRRAAAWLVERGYVRKRIRYKASGAQDTNLLQIVLDEPDEQLALPSAGGGGETPTPQRGEGESHPPREGATPPPPLGATPPPRGGGQAPTKRTHLNDPTTNTTAGTLADEFVQPAHRDVYLALRSSHRLPVAFDATLRTLHTPLSGGVPYTWHEIGAGLLSQAGNGETFNELRLRGYCRAQREAQAAPPRGAARRAEGSAGAAASQVSSGFSLGGQAFTLASLWDLCISHGLTAAMQSRETIHERIAVLHGQGLVADPAAFEALVLHVQPWSLNDIRFVPEREKQLTERIARWSAAVTQGAA